MTYHFFPLMIGKEYGWNESSRKMIGKEYGWNESSREVVWNFKGDKAPCCDGFTMAFFKSVGRF
jgi:hypothetical protein